MECSAQVISRLEKDEKTVRCDFAILDMDINCYSRLSISWPIQQTPYSHVSNRVEMDALWEFFFETGFIYPEKYDLIQSKKEAFKETYVNFIMITPKLPSILSTKEMDGFLAIFR